MASIPPGQQPRRKVVGVDTHEHVHAAVALDALDALGGRFGGLTIPATTDGHARLERWARALGDVAAFGVEGTGSYGAGLSRFLRRRGHHVVEVNRPDRRLRRVSAARPTASTPRCS